MPLLGPREKGELEKLILGRLEEHYDHHGSLSLLAPGLCVVVNSSGVAVTATGAEIDEALARVEVRSLFTALCYLASDGTQAMARESLASLATEATSATAAQINKIASTTDP